MTCTKQELIDLGITYVDDKILVFNNREHKPRAQKNGYLRYHLPNKQDILVHRANYIWNVGDIPEGITVDHIDYDITNNKLDNLRLATHYENCTIGRRNYGVHNFNGTLYGRKWREANREHYNEYMRQYRARKRQEAESLGEVGEAKQFAGT